MLRFPLAWDTALGSCSGPGVEEGDASQGRCLADSPRDRRCRGGGGLMPSNALKDIVPLDLRLKTKCFEESRDQTFFILGCF